MSSACSFCPDRTWRRNAYQGREQSARSAYPLGQCRAIYFHAFALVNLRLAIQRKMIAILRDQHMGQKSRACDTPLDRPAGRWGLYDAVAAGTGQLRSNLTNHFDSLEHILQDFRNIFAQMLQLSATVGASFLLRQVGLHFPPQMRG